jgi:HAMP domain-containing protein
VRLRLSHERRVLLLTLAGGAPALMLALALVWSAPAAPALRLAAAAVPVATWVACSLLVRRAMERPLQTLTNLLSALREGDFSFRAHVERPQPGALAELQQEVNALAATLQQQRMWATEAAVLLRKVMDAVDVAVFAFDDARKLRLVNAAWLGRRTTSAWGSLWRARPRGSSTSTSRAAAGAGRCGAATSANAGCRWTSSCCRTSAVPYGRRSGGPGSGSCGCSVTS